MAFSHHHHRPLASLNLVFRPPSLHPANSSLRLRYYTKSRSPSLPLSERSANLLVGTTIATCVGISAYSAWAFLKPQTNPNPEPGLHRPRRHGQPQESLLSRITNPTPEFVRQNLILTRTNIVEGRYWTLLTSTLTHLTPLHLLFNMSTLWSFGLPLARLYGARAYLGVWIGSGLVGSLAGLASEGKDMRASAGVEEGGKVVVTERGYLGASGSIMGMLSVMTCFAPRAKIGFMFVVSKKRVSACSSSLVVLVSFIIGSWLMVSLLADRYPSLGVHDCLLCG